MRPIGFAMGTFVLGLCCAPVGADELLIELSNYRYAGWFSAVTPDGSVGIGYVNTPDGYDGLRWDGSTLVPYDTSFAHTQPLFISDNGRIVGGSRGNGITSQSGRWVDDVWTPITAYSGGNTGLAGMSADGTVLVGTSNVFTQGVGNEGRAFRLDTSTDSLTDSALMTFGGVGQSYAKAVSADGLVVIGAADKNNVKYAFRWAVGDDTIEDLLPDTPSEAKFVSADGSIVALSANLAAYRWTAATSAVLLDGLNDDRSGPTFITGMNRDGSVIVGAGLTADNQARAIRWIGTEAENLGTIGDLQSLAYTVSGDGKAVFGLVTSDINGNAPTEAFRWTDGKGMRLVTDLLAEGGVDVGDWNADVVLASSHDGTVFGGIGSSRASPGVWMARCTSACAVIKQEDLARSFAGLGAMGATTSLHLGAEINAGADMASAARASGMPATAFAYGAYDSDPTTSFSVGATYRLGDDLVIGGSTGVAGIDTDLTDGGHSAFSAPTVTGFIAARPASGPNWSLGISGAAFSGSITRAYLNGVDPVTSTGRTSGTGLAIGGELGWTFDALLADVLVTPFVGVTLSSASFAGYTETDGPFPAAIDGFTTRAALIKLGVDGRYRFGTDAYVNGGIAYGHNAADGGTVSGAVPGIMGASTSGATLPADFVEASIGVDMPVSDALRFSARAALTMPFDGTPSVQARAGFSFAF